jgi:hypothetical protein
MGFDILIYQNNGKRDLFEISEFSHKELFSNNDQAKKMFISSLLLDYYKANLTINTNDVKSWIEELNLLNEHTLSYDSKKQLQQLIDALSNKLIEKVHIAGD